MITALGFSRLWCSLLNYASILLRSHFLLTRFLNATAARSAYGATTAMLVRLTPNDGIMCIANAR